MNIRRLEDKNDFQKWDAFVMNHPDGAISHLSCWKNVLEKTFKHFEPLYLILDEDGLIRGGIPCFVVNSYLTGKRIVSLPLTDNCSPLVSTKEDLLALIDYLIMFKEKIGAKYIELKPKNSIHLEQLSKLIPYYYYYNHELMINKEPDLLRKSFDRTCIRQRISRAEKSNITIIHSASSYDIEKFHRLHVLLRKRHGLPPMPFLLFANMWEFLNPENKMILNIAMLNNTEIAAIIALPFGNTVQLEFAASNDAYMQYSPNHLLYWELIKFAYHKGYQTVDFGRTSPDNEGLLQFKRRWGTREKVVPYFYFPEAQGVSAENRNSMRIKAIKTICSKLPDNVLKLVGNYVYNHLG
jgi:hypothetical protein